MVCLWIATRRVGDACHPLLCPWVPQGGIPQAGARRPRMPPACRAVQLRAHGSGASVVRPPSRRRAGAGAVARGTPSVARGLVYYFLFEGRSRITVPASILVQIQIRERDDLSAATQSTR